MEIIKHVIKLEVDHKIIKRYIITSKSTIMMSKMHYDVKKYKSMESTS